MIQENYITINIDRYSDENELNNELIRLNQLKLEYSKINPHTQNSIENLIRIEEGIAYIYYNLEDYKKAISTIEVVDSLTSKFEKVYPLYYYFCEIGKAYENLEQIDKSKEYYLKCFMNAEKYYLDNYNPTQEVNTTAWNLFTGLKSPYNSSSDFMPAANLMELAIQFRDNNLDDWQVSEMEFFTIANAYYQPFETILNIDSLVVVANLEHEYSKDSLKAAWRYEIVTTGFLYTLANGEFNNTTSEFYTEAYNYANLATSIYQNLESENSQYLCLSYCLLAACAYASDMEECIQCYQKAFEIANVSNYQNLFLRICQELGWCLLLEERHDEILILREKELERVGEWYGKKSADYAYSLTHKAYCFIDGVRHFNKNEYDIETFFIEAVQILESIEENKPKIYYICETIAEFLSEESKKIEWYNKAINDAKKFNDEEFVNKINEIIN